MFTKNHLSFALLIIFTMIGTLKSIAQPPISTKKATPPPPSNVKLDNRIFLLPDENATPKNGEKAFYKYINKNLKYPDSAHQTGINDTVIVQCVVEKDGTLSDFRVEKGINKEYNEEAIRVLKSSPRWNPAKQLKKPIRYLASIAIFFKLEKKK
ncbi:MAG TPA: hypothetical protein DCS93_24130 [Microscillaceae bacterium]|nr:hypothetical protein [Microscillaceae bacterium]